MLSRVLATIREHDLIGSGERVLVAVSGGPDSTALLSVLANLASRLGISLAAAAVDHGLRPSSAAEANDVRRRCQAQGIACEVLNVDVGQARRRHVSIQEAARTARLAVLEQTAARLGCAKVALGHTADDQVETVLFRILRGTGIAGLAGIPYRRGILVRPLLDVRRAQVIAFLSKRKLDYISDPSNLDRHYARVRIRHDVLPALRRENPRLDEALLSLAIAARGEGDRPWQERLPPDLYLTRRTLEAIDGLVRSGQGTRRIVVRGGAILVRYGQVAWEAHASGGSGGQADAAPRPLSVAGPGIYAVTASAKVEITPFSPGPWPRGRAPCFDVAKVIWPLLLRTWRLGDRMMPRGGCGSRKLSDLFVDAKIPRDDRVALPVLCDGEGTILFVPGLRPSQAGRPDASTRHWFLVRVLR